MLGDLFKLSLAILLSPIIFLVALLDFLQFSKVPRLLGTALGGKRRKRPYSCRGRLILLAVDETSLPAVEWSCRELISSDDFVHIIHAIEPGEKAEHTSVTPFRFFSSTPTSALGIIKGLVDVVLLLKSYNIQYDGKVTSPSDTDESTASYLIAAINDIQPDLVVLGSSKRTGPFDIGSIATKVALSSPAMVTLVK